MNVETVLFIALGISFMLIVFLGNEVLRLKQALEFQGMCIKVLTLQLPPREDEDFP